MTELSLREHLIAYASSGLLASGTPADEAAERAIALADDVVARLSAAERTKEVVYRGGEERRRPGGPERAGG